jgi:hypothetical protein
MEFASANPSVVRYITQRVLLNAWLRAARKHHPLPLLIDFDPGDINNELSDMMGYDVEGDHGEPRFLIRQEGTRLAATYGNDHIDPAQRTNRYLHEAIGPERYGRVVASYHACLNHRRPIYAVSTVQDADGKDVSYERLLLPFGFGEKVEQIVGSFKAVSIEGGFKVHNLMGLRATSVPVIRVQAVIDRTVSATPEERRGEDVVEL